jgi:hypothetical protein
MDFDKVLSGIILALIGSTGLMLLIVLGALVFLVLKLTFAGI